MPTYVQAERPLKVSTPLGKDVLLLVGFSGHEAISQPFQYQLDVLAENTAEVAFEKLLGQKIAVSLLVAKGKNRYFHGICSQVGEGNRDEHFTAYRMQVVPHFWLLTRRVQSRIFQQLNVIDILKKVLTGLDVSFETQGTFEPRDFCVQYQESDFHFASRLMEEEGIFYFFKHTADGHQMVLGNGMGSHPAMPDQVKYVYEQVENGLRDEFRIHEWRKVQEVRSGKVTLWDHCFELPHKHLEAEQIIQESVPVGKVTHKLNVADNEKLEVYNYPGAYAQRFDGVDKTGSEQSAELKKIFTDNKRTAGIRMQEEAAQSLVIRGSGNGRSFTCGHKFILARHWNADGPYLLTGVQHRAKLSGNYRSGTDTSFDYSNTFTCLPLLLPFRPPRVTPRPRILGTQTAVVVGPMSKEEIFTDKYGRVKVQFHWDREGKYKEDSSCWIRVATAWAGKGWGQINIPRLGHEVIVDFLEGDPDNPIIVGSVYNAENMPAQKLPEGRKTSGLVTRTNDSSAPGHNQMTCDDAKGKERIIIHGQYDMETRIEHDQKWTVHNNRKLNVDVDNLTIVGGNDDTTVSGEQSLSVTKQQVITLAANRDTKITAQDKLKIGGYLDIDVTGPITLKSGVSIKLLVGASELFMKADGSIKLTGDNIVIDGASHVTLHGTSILSHAEFENTTKGAMVLSHAGATNTVQGGAAVLLNPG